MMKYIDIHAHINFEDYDNDRDQVISRTKESETLVIGVGTDKKTSKEVTDLSDNNDNMYAIIGLHPLYVQEEDFDTSIYNDLVKNPKVVGIGECGLDFSREVSKDKQIEVFKKQIELALQYEKPLMIHCREAYPEVLSILKQYPGIRANFHFFSGTIEEAKEILDLGFYVSFTGVITFAKDYEELVNLVPINRIMSETDCPYVTPVPYRGKRNEPIYVKEVVKKIAEIKEMDEEEVRKNILQNAKSFFKID